MTCPYRQPGGFTLLELVLAMIVMSVVAVIVMPVTVSATESFAQARSLREISESTLYALDRVVRLIREAPGGEATALDLIAADQDEIVFADGRGVRLTGTDLLLVSGDAEFPLLRGVSSFELVYLESDGLTAAGEPANAQRVQIRLSAQGMDLATVVFPRALVGGDL